MKRNLSSTGLAMALACVVLGAACNDSNDNPSPTAAPTPPPAPAAVVPTPPPPVAEGPVPGEEVSFLGKVREVEGDLVRVNQDDVVVTANTFLVNEAGDPISMADFKVGSVVRVKGSYNQDASAIDARRITLLE